jgi:RNA polymerase sigma factor for flagellar operon FliA
MSEDKPESQTPLTPAQQKLAVDHFFLLDEQARGLRHTFAAISFEELTSFGYIGLLRAAKAYRPETGIGFPAFASHRIRGSIIDEVRRLSRYSERQQERRKEIRRAERLLEEKRARQKELGETAEQLIQFLDNNPMPQYVSFDAAAAVTTAEVSPETAVHYARIRERVRQIAVELGTEERALVSRIYFRNMNLQEAADDIGLNKSWASRLHARAIRFLQAAFRREPS